MIREGLAFVAFESIERDLERFLEYIPAETQQWDVFSFKLSDIIIRSCSQLDSLFKEIIKTCDLSTHSNQAKVKSCKNKIENNNIGIMDYLDLFVDFYQLSSIGIDSKRGYFSKPFENLEEDLSKRQPPKWWSDYNKLKHDYYDNKELGNLGNAIDSMAALFSINCKVKDVWDYLIINRKFTSPNFKDTSHIFYYLKKHPDLDKYSFIVRSELFEFYLKYDEKTIGITVMGSIKMGID